MTSKDPRLAGHYATVIEFLLEHKSFASRVRDAEAISSSAYIEKMAESFARAREDRYPTPPTTIPDEMIGLVLHNWFDIESESLKKVEEAHRLSMAAENFIGEALELFLASVLEKNGWIWCSGSMVKSVDFIKPPSAKGKAWLMLQVKNRDNSENSSSSKVRAGTDIMKWHRTFSKKTGDNWAKFPDSSLRSQLTEANFRAFLERYLNSKKTSRGIGQAAYRRSSLR